MRSLANEMGNDMIVAFNTTSRDMDNCSISIIFTLNKWFTEFILLKFSQTKQILLIPKHLFLDFNLLIHNGIVSTKKS